MRELKVRALRPEEQPALLEWLKKAKVVDASELPHGFVGHSTQTAVVEKDGEILMSLTGTKAFAIGPLIKNPDAKPIELMSSVLHAARALEFYASLDGATEAYIVISDELPAFQRIVERAGYERVAENCKIYRRLLLSGDEVKITEEEQAEAHDEDSPSDSH